MPDGVAAVLAEEGLAARVTFTVEQGHIGGVPGGRRDFGMCINPDASLDAGHQFDWYDGGGLDVAVLSFAQVDAGRERQRRALQRPRVPASGASSTSRRAPSGWCSSAPSWRAVRYRSEGERRSTVPDVGHPQAGGARSSRSASRPRGRCRPGSPSPTSPSERSSGSPRRGSSSSRSHPGLDLETDVLDHMGFKPLISPQLREMDARIFRHGAAGSRPGARRGGGPPVSQERRAEDDDVLLRERHGSVLVATPEPAPQGQRVEPRADRGSRRTGHGPRTRRIRPGGCTSPRPRRRRREGLLGRRRRP